MELTYCIFSFHLSLRLVILLFAIVLFFKCLLFISVLVLILTKLKGHLYINQSTNTSLASPFACF